MERYYLEKANYGKFIDSLKAITPGGINDALFGGEFPHYRHTTPFIKTFLLDARSRVDEFKNHSSNKTVLFGLKACDLASVPILDYVFEKGAFIDPFYETKRKSVVVVSGDCTDCLDTCFCTLVGNLPYPEKYYDVNLSPIRGGYIVSVATESGNSILPMDILAAAASDQLKMMEMNRQNIKEKVINNVKSKDYNIVISGQRTVMDNFNSPVWEEAALTCVECGACNLVCPTCHCFILSEHDEKRYRQWDACQYKGFALVAGGGNPRKRLHQRLRNRYEKKFDYFQKNIGLNACTGCGRCVRACIGKIDMREVLKKLAAK